MGICLLLIFESFILMGNRDAPHLCYSSDLLMTQRRPRQVKEESRRAANNPISTWVVHNMFPPGVTYSSDKGCAALLNGRRKTEEKHRSLQGACWWASLSSHPAPWVSQNQTADPSCLSTDCAPGAWVRRQRKRGHHLWVKGGKSSLHWPWHSTPATLSPPSVSISDVTW